MSKSKNDGVHSSVLSGSHQNLYKHNGISLDVLHQKHRDETVELRKKKRNDRYERTRRYMGLARDQDMKEPELRSVFDQHLMEDLIAYGDERRIMSALQAYLCMFSIPENVEQMHEAQLVEVFVSIFMKSNAFSDLEALSIVLLSKLSSDFSRVSSYFQDPGVIAKLVNSLGSLNVETLENSLFLLEEVVRLSPDARAICDSGDILPTSIDLYFKYDNVSLRRQILTLLDNYFELERPAHELTDKLIDFLRFLILNDADELILNNTFEILTRLANFSRLHAEMLVTKGFLSDIIGHLGNELSRSWLSLVKTLAFYGEDYVTTLSSLGFFEKVWLIVTSTNHSEKLSDALLTVARFIKYGYLNANPAAAEFIADQLIHCLGASGFNVRRQTLFTVEQLLSVCNDANILIKFTQPSCLGDFCDLLTVMHVDTVASAITCLDRIMDFGVTHGIDADLRESLERCNALEKFDFLVTSQSSQIFKKADSFMAKYFEDTRIDD